MADIEITVDGGTSKRLLTAGKYCDKNILVTTTGGGGDVEPPDDGKTRLYITVPANSMPNLPPPRNQVPLYIQQSVANGVTIDWGDGTPPETLAGTGNVNTTHTYEQAGDYVISLEPADGCELGFGKLDESEMKIFNITGFDSMKQKFGFPYNSYLNSIYFLNDFYIEDQEYGWCPAAFSFCFNLKSIEIPNGILKIGFSCFTSCVSLNYVKLPDSLIEIKDNSFYNCGSLAEITIPNNVQKICQGAFDECKGMKIMHLLPIVPPTLDSAFYNLPSDCIIYVPVGSLESYQTATNWAVYSSYMREEGT